MSPVGQCNYSSCSSMAAPERKRCEHHLRMACEDVALAVFRKQNRGVCLRSGCHAFAETGKAQCAEHLAKNVVETRQVRKNRNLRGLCASCPNPCNGKVICSECTRKGYERVKRKKGPRLCPKCKQHECGYNQRICAACRVERIAERTDTSRLKIRDLMKQRSSGGLCIRCGKSEPAPFSSRCAECLAYARAYQARKYGARVMAAARAEETYVP